MTLKLTLGLLSFATFAQTPGQKPPEVKGLVVTSTVLDPSTHQLTVDLQNTSTKTIVAYAVLITQLDATGKTVIESGVGWDYLEPDGEPHYILAGRPATVEATKILDKTVVSVKVSVTGVIYIDRTYEGPGPSGGMFDGRMRTAAEIRKILAEEQHTAAEKTKLEKRAAFYEAAAIPQEGK